MLTTFFIIIVLPYIEKLVSFLNFIEQSKIPKSKGFPPFEKGGPGGISKPIHLKNPPRSPFSKGGSIIFIYELIEFKKDTKIVIMPKNLTIDYIGNAETKSTIIKIFCI